MGPQGFPVLYLDMFTYKKGKMHLNESKKTINWT